MVSVFAVRTSLKSVEIDFVEERVARALRRTENEASTRSEARCARKAVNGNRYWFGFRERDLRSAEEAASARIQANRNQLDSCGRFVSASCRSLRPTTCDG